MLEGGVAVYGGIGATTTMGNVLDIRSDPRTIDAAWMSAALSDIARGATLLDCRFEGFVGTGQTGCNGRFSLDWSDPQGRPTSVMGKFPSLDDTARATGFGGSAYVTEFNFYSRVASTVKVRAPHCHHAALDLAAQQFCLIMEDLSESEQGDQFVGLTIDEAELAIEQAVLMHAPRWGDPTLSEIAANPSTLEERAAALSMIYSMLLPAFIDRLGARLEDEIVRLISDFAPHVGKWALGSGTPLTLSHYDFRPDNFLFARSASAPPLVIVDWQTANQGLGMVDTAYMIAGSFTPERRRDVEVDLVDAYRERLNAAGITYDRDTCWRDYRFGSLWGLIITVLATSMAARTERGDDLFVTMATQHGHQAIDHDAMTLVNRG
ncbi:MAG: phosphotransferase [Actinomycetota bacterium]